MDWKELRDGSLRVEQHFITPKQSQRQILVGKNGSKIGYTLPSDYFSIYDYLFSWPSTSIIFLKKILMFIHFSPLISFCHVFRLLIFCIIVKEDTNRTIR